MDPTNNIVAIAHAGWRGSVQDISKVVLESLSNQFNCNSNNILVFLGPSAGICCYAVSQDFVQNIELEFVQQVIIYKENKIFFNLSKYNKIKLLKSGIKEENIIEDYNLCTICSNSFFSYRAGNAYERQISFVFIA